MKTLGDMREEVYIFCLEKGWYDKPVRFSESMVLLHSEISEVLEAYRVWGMADGTDIGLEAWNETLPKPEGVGSEMADILIRMLDDSKRWSISMEQTVISPRVHKHFVDNLEIMHKLVCQISDAYGGGDISVYMSRLFVFLVSVCIQFGVDLTAEYERKMAYNRTRSYRHGDKVV